MNIRNLNINLSNYHFLITGASGFIGSYLSKQLFDLGAKLTLFDKKFSNNHWSKVENSKNLNIFECNILDKNSLEKF